MRYRIRAYNAGSRSARALAVALGGRVLRSTGSTFRPRRDDVIVNWGSSEAYAGGPATVLNAPAAVAAAANKLRSFEAFRAAGVSIPEFWTRREDIPADAYPVICRTLLSGHSGAGIVIAENAGELVNAPLYTRYVPKQDEYRVHVFGGRVIAVQRKARRNDVENPNWRIRNHANGFVFAREGVVAPQQVIEQSIMAVAALGLDFGGVDVIFNRHRDTAYVLEINTACGLEGQTVNDYADAIRGR